ncbi:DUF4062 domain-containing protein [Vibrio splendidus]|uniref:DUF4062 domain-containing protein n=1 Tax=Vibrio splendidus TaxID=29497 RepID=UPI002735C7FC|nr:DUF4062 domain-containing protein [Vibrio splendidus]MDP2591644.1 DUF4062 domain-containing protein [Vibrio splendidus]
MAKPRVFLSSTYYDLKQVRSDLERFIEEQGYDSILNEKGNIPYGSQEKLEEYCYKEINHCDILVSIIGGRYGSQSHEGEYSVSNKELLAALKQGKQVYIFIDDSVATEYRTYEVNKGVKGMSYAAVDNEKVYEFLEEVYRLPRNNIIHNFKSSNDITRFLKEQWAGLFQRLLSDESKRKEVNLIQKLSETSETLNQLVEFLVEERKDSNEAINHILSINHPAFGDIQRIAQIPFRVYFDNTMELLQILTQMDFHPINRDQPNAIEGFASWFFPEKDEILRISKAIFTGDLSKGTFSECKLKLFTSANWSSDYIYVDDNIVFDEDIPF